MVFRAAATASLQSCATAFFKAMACGSGSAILWAQLCVPDATSAAYSTADGNNVKIKTHGYGKNESSVIAFMNDKFGPSVFNGHDEYLRQLVLSGPIGVRP